MNTKHKEQLHTVATRLKKKVDSVKVTPENAALINEVITLLDLILDRKE
jgi:hypothetical protein